MRSCRIASALALVATILFTCQALAVELAVLTAENWDEYVIAGKEADAIYGDFVLRNERITAVIAQPLATRNANMTVRGVGGYVIDLTERQAQNDQLSAYFPGGGRYEFFDPAKTRVWIDEAEKPAAELKNSSSQGQSITVELKAQPREGSPQLAVRYTLAGDAPFLLVEAVYSNPTERPVEEDVTDAIRADRTFTFGVHKVGQQSLFFADDEWFRQAYGVLVAGDYELKLGGDRARVIQFHAGGNNKLRLEPGQSKAISRRLFPASSMLALRGLTAELTGGEAGKVTMKVIDPQPVAQARVTLRKDGQAYAAGRTNAEGLLAFSLPAGEYAATIESTDGRSVTATLTGGNGGVTIASLPTPSRVVATITGSDGQPIPAKVSFTGTSGTKDPDWGPDSGDTAIKNVYYTHDGKFTQPIAPGSYDVIVSYGPEHDAVFTTIQVPPGGDAELKAVLKRSVDTKGWVSADFHSHSSPSGDNTSSQLGRVLNLLCEHVEFAPCTEHNRIDTYVPHLKHLGVEHLMATCTGMELTGGPLPVNHQNAFPLHHHPHTQDGGAPVTDLDPVVQVERLAFWDNKSDKLVQMNHPNLPQILGDRDLDGKPDAGFERMFGFVDVIEVHPPQGIFTPPEKQANGQLSRNPIFHWMQMLNLGYRHTAVINTDSHYNYHESGFYRNFIKSKTDDPARIDTMEMVHESEHGHVVVSTGPFLSVSAKSNAAGPKGRAIPGDDLSARDGHVELTVKVQCPNWFDVNRVQVFLNGKPEESLNFTRRTHADRFTDQTVRFEATIPLELTTDAHVIVATIGEGLQLGPVMGPRWGETPPVAVANPIFVDVDGEGFTPNKDLLGVPLPIDPDRPITRGHGHRHEH